MKKRGKIVVFSVTATFFFIFNYPTLSLAVLLAQNKDFKRKEKQGNGRGMKTYGDHASNLIRGKNIL